MNPALDDGKPAGIDFGLPFFPARLTALAQVPSWRKLDARQQTRYTQIYALYLNEQIAFFEELLATNLLPALYRRPDRIGEGLAENLRRFEAEERRHSRWFREMNHRIDPLNFSLEPSRYRFVPSGGAGRALTVWLARRPFLFPAWIWLILLQEERSIALSRECLKESEALEPRFVELHRRHMADEVDHVNWDLQLIEVIWLPLPMWRRRLLARIFGRMMKEFFTAPKRSGKAVLQALLDEFPGLAPLAGDLHRELAGLGESPAYHASLYSRELTPRAFAWFDKLPEFEDIGRHLLAYHRS